MNIQLSDRIKQYEKGFSKGQRLIAKFIMEHYDRAAYMTASKLGSTVGVSESTVVRFATEVGYTGYPQMQQAMHEMIRNKLTTVQRLEHTSSHYGERELLDASFNQDIDIIKRTNENLSREEFFGAIEALMNAKTIYILGAGSSLALATFVQYYFNLIFEDVRMINATSEAATVQQMIRLSDKDAVVGISFPRYSRKTVKALSYADGKNAATIAITDTSLSPLAQHSRYRLYAKSDMVSFVDSLVGPLSLINALIVSVAIKKKKEVSEILTSLEVAWDEFGTYEKIDEKNS